jgi:hypothetical protein
MWVKSGRLGTQRDRIRATILTLRNTSVLAPRTRVTTRRDWEW